MLNRVILIGRTSREPDIRRTASGMAKANFPLAVDRPKDKEGKITTDFIECVAWDKTAEAIEKYVGKGKLIAVEGRIQNRNYEDKEGNKRYITEVIVENMRMLDKKSESVSKSSVTQETVISSVANIDEDELPF